MTLNDICGTGKIVEEGNNLKYVGSIPFKKDDKVVLLKLEDLESILLNGLNSLLIQKMGMDVNLANSFPSELILNHKDGNKYNLFRENIIYTPNIKDMCFIRYVSVDESWEEEGEDILDKYGK